MKTCNTCNEAKPLTEFYAHERMRDGYFNRCKACDRARARESMRLKRETVPNYSANANLRRNYGIGVAEYERRFAAQDRRCAVCGASTPGGRGARFHVDHDHGTGEVRGLLCHGCNTGLGAFGDDEDRLVAAAAYLLARKNVLEAVTF